MAFNWGAYNLDEDVRLEQNSLSSAASKRAKAKGTGGSIGGLLGGIIGQILIPIPGVGAAIGAGLGSAAGSMAGGAISGVTQKDLLGGNYMRNTRGTIVKDMAKAQMDQAVSSAGKAFFSGFMPGGNLNKFGKGFKEGAGMGTEGIPGLQGGHALVGGKDMGAFMGGMQGGIQGLGISMPSFMGGGGGDVVASEASKAAVMDVEVPGLLGKAAPNFPGMNDPLTMNIMQSGGADPTMLARIQQYQKSGWAPDDTIDMDLWQQMQGGQ